MPLLDNNYASVAALLPTADEAAAARDAARARRPSLEKLLPSPRLPPPPRKSASAVRLLAAGAAVTERVRDAWSESGPPAERRCAPSGVPTRRALRASSDSMSSVVSSSSAASASTAASAASRDAAHAYQQQLVSRLLAVHEAACAEGGATHGRSFAFFLQKEFPSLSEARRAQMARVAKALRGDRDEVRRRRRHAWTADEVEQIGHLFAEIDADGSGTISEQEWLTVASGEGVARAEVKAVWRAQAAAGGDGMRLPEFIAFAASSPALAAHVRGLLASLAAQRRREGERLARVEETRSERRARLRGRDSLAVAGLDSLHGGGAARPAEPARLRSREELMLYDDGQSQVWRLVPGGRALVKKEKVSFVRRPSFFTDGAIHERPSLATLPSAEPLSPARLALLRRLSSGSQDGEEGE